MKELILMYIKGQLKGIFTQRDLDNYSGRVWWDKTRHVYVPFRDYEVGRINVNNIQQFIKTNRK